MIQSKCLLVDATRRFACTHERVSKGDSHKIHPHDSWLSTMSIFEQVNVAFNTEIRSSISLHGKRNGHILNVQQAYSIAHKNAKICSSNFESLWSSFSSGSCPVCTLVRHLSTNLACEHNESPYSIPVMSMICCDSQSTYQPNAVQVV